MQQNEKPLPQLKRTSMQIYFKQDEMDFQFRWIMGCQTHQGAEMGECFHVASKIEDGNPISWGQEWFNFAKKVEGRAEEALKKGHNVSAREAFLRARSYYRAALFIMSPKNPLFPESIFKQRSCFQKAAILFDPPVESIQVPFNGKKLQGYFWPVDNSGKKRKTLLMIGGGETFVEDCWFYIAPAAIKRGYNVIMADLPGQGTTPLDGLYVRPDMEVPMKAVLDYVVSRPEIDADRLAAYGISWGGYIVLRSAIYDKRIKACIANSPLWDLERAFASKPIVPPDVVSSVVTQQLAWRREGGIHPRLAKTLEEKRKLYSPFKYDPSKVKCPVLCLASSGEEDEMKAEAQEAYEVLTNPKKKLVILTEEDGAESHCHGDNLSLMSQVVFDWLDELFEK